MNRRNIGMVLVAMALLVVGALSSLAAERAGSRTATATDPQAALTPIADFLQHNIHSNTVIRIVRPDGTPVLQSVVGTGIAPSIDASGLYIDIPMTQVAPNGESVARIPLAEIRYAQNTPNGVRQTVDLLDLHVGPRW